jgi:hypothetical protein
MPSTGANSPNIASSPTPPSSGNHGGSTGLVQPLSDIDEQSEEETEGWMSWLALTVVLAAVVTGVVLLVRRKARVLM